jgi:hypothetical protein
MSYFSTPLYFRDNVPMGLVIEYDYVVPDPDPEYMQIRLRREDNGEPLTDWAKWTADDLPADVAHHFFGPSRPKVGDIVEVVVGEYNEEYATVLATFNSLDNDWGDYGHENLGLREDSMINSVDNEDETPWYAVLRIADSGDHIGVRSYEVVPHPGMLAR